MSLKFQKIIRTALTALTVVLLAGCATTRVTTHVAGGKPPLCEALTTTETALVLWGAAWRDNQKEVALREEMAGRALTRSFETSSCYARVAVLRQAMDREAIGLSDAEALQFASSLSLSPDKIILVRVEELGPFIILHPSPVLWEGGTEVQLRVRMLDAKTSALEADIAVHWRDGGAFVLKGTGTLEQDLESALASVFGRADRKAP